MIGHIFITRTGYDPKLGKHIKDPTLDSKPTLGACRPDVRRQLQQGDHIFVISGKVKQANQFIIGGFEIDHKITADQAYLQFPEHRLTRRSDGQLSGNILVDANGEQHSLDDHAPKSFDARKNNYVVGTNLVSLDTIQEVNWGREETLDVLRSTFQKNGESPFEIVGHFGRRINERQIEQLRDWFASIKSRSN